MRPDGIAVLPPTGNKADVFCILEYKHMSDITDQYLITAKAKVENNTYTFEAPSAMRYIDKTGSWN